MSTQTETKTKKSPKTLKNLVIVESPSKAKTIKHYLGKNFEVKSSVGHIIDLPKSRLGVDTKDFTPDYIVMRDKSKVMKELKEAIKSASSIYLASDPDREGEAIAWHLKNYFSEKVLPKIKSRKIPIYRVRFEEVTKDAVQKAIKNKEPIKESLVNAQQARRIIDRLFGYELSPLLWKKVKSKLSAGRVQSISLKIICDKEKEIEKFIPTKYYQVDATLQLDKRKLDCKLFSIDKVKIYPPQQQTKNSTYIKTEKEAKLVETTLKTKPILAQEMKTKEIKHSANPPFITSTLQQSANNLLGYPAAKTMRAAQSLFEGINLKKGRTGLITYMRTDSTRIAPIALEKVREYIKTHIGEKYLPEKINYYKNKKNAQDAHEAIRPTDVDLTPELVKPYLSSEEFKIYNLIWRRFVSSQMVPSQNKSYSINFTCENLVLVTNTSTQIFDGFLNIYNFSKKEKNKELPEIKDNTKVKYIRSNIEEKFTEPPARFNEASLIKLMEEKEIGRPSTYAPILYTLTKRYYVKKEGKQLKPTILGNAVNDLLEKNFPDLLNITFTSNLEKSLDKIENNEKDWKNVVGYFYTPFHHILEEAYENIDSIKGITDEDTNFLCEKCHAPMKKKLGKFGFFLACSRWPECNFTMSLPLGKCPKCHTGYVQQKKVPRKRAFYGCSHYPECDFATYLVPIENSACPKCQSVLFTQKVNGKNKKVCLNEGCTYEDTKD